MQQTNTMYKILSLDGGGTWAILQLLTLRERYPGEKGHAILRHFDLVIANSGGSLVLAALAEDWDLDKAIGLFRDKTQREQIFSKNSFWERFFPVDYIRSIGPKYSAKRKGKAFKEIFTESNKRQMNELPAFIGKPSLKIIVCTYDALNNRAKFFKSFGSGPGYDSVRLTQAIHGSSNAPIQYFDFPARFKAKNSEIYYELWDGALGGFNNPVAAGVIEAIKSGVPKSEIVVISLGTSNKLMSMDDKDTFYRIKQIAIRERHKKYLVWRIKYQTQFFMKSIYNQAKTILYEPPDWSNYVAYMHLHGESYHLGNPQQNLARFVRLSPLIHMAPDATPELLALLQQLYKMDMNLTTDAEVDTVLQCFEQWKNDRMLNQTIEFSVDRQNGIHTTIGHSRFSEGMAAWRGV
ncbi:MAG: patatin-like phospholipase family protein [Flavobacterium sp.]|nr:patatin-like phospholipase family protein [Flavobacterium sp.]